MIFQQARLFQCKAQPNYTVRAQQAPDTLMTTNDIRYKLSDLEIDDWYLLARMMMRCCEMSGEEIHLDLNETILERGIREVEGDELNYNQFDLMMKNLGENSIIEWDAYAPDDVTYPDFSFTFNKSSFEFIRTNVLNKLYIDRTSLKEKITKLENELESVYGFQPSLINEEIIKTNKKANELLSIIKKK